MIMNLQEFDEIMEKTVERYKALHEHYLDLYRELTDEQVKDRFVLWDNEEPEVP